MTSPQHFNLRQLNGWIFSESAAGIQISGDSGSGKSNVLEVLAQNFSLQGQPFLFIDPHGSSAKRIERFVCSLPPRLQRRFLVMVGTTGRGWCVNIARVLAASRLRCSLRARRAKE